MPFDGTSGYEFHLCHAVETESPFFVAELAEGLKIKIIETADYLDGHDYAPGLITGTGQIADMKIFFGPDGFFEKRRERYRFFAVEGAPGEPDVRGVKLVERFQAPLDKFVEKISEYLVRGDHVRHRPVVLFHVDLEVGRYVAEAVGRKIEILAGYLQSVYGLEVGESPAAVFKFRAEETYVEGSVVAD